MLLATWEFGIAFPQPWTLVLFSILLKTGAFFNLLSKKKKKIGNWVLPSWLYTCSICGTRQFCLWLTLGIWQGMLDFHDTPNQSWSHTLLCGPQPHARLSSAHQQTSWRVQNLAGASSSSVFWQKAWQQWSHDVSPQQAEQLHLKHDEISLFCFSNDVLHHRRVSSSPVSDHLCPNMLMWWGMDRRMVTSGRVIPVRWIVTSGW